MSHLKPQQVMIELCCLSYLDESSTNAQQIQQAINTGMTSEEYHLKEWSVTWGPVLSADSIFMMYVAGNPTANEYAVVIRGTDEGSIQAWLIDLDLTLVAPPYGSGISITQGVLDGINALNAMTYNSQTLVQYLQSLAGSPTTYITGHSFGSALAVAYAPWLVAQGIPAPRVITFAGPTAGDLAFASYFNGLFPSAESYVNTLDVVPNLWATVLDIAQYYQPPGPACPGVVADLVVIANSLVQGMVQTGGQVQKTGTVQGGDSWFAEAEYQHDHFTYARLFHLHLQPRINDEMEIRSLLASGRLGTGLTNTAGGSRVVAVGQPG